MTEDAQHHEKPEPEAPTEEGRAGQPQSQAGPPGPAAVTISATEYEELKTLAAERDDYLQRLRRAVADYLNLQKRIDKMKADAQRDALRRITRLVLPLADSLARALEVAERTRGAEHLTQGLQVIEKEFYAILRELGVRPIEAKGLMFDPNYHEAILEQPADGVAPNTVIGELKKGFLLGEELLRPAQVVVSGPPPEPNQGQQ